MWIYVDCFDDADSKWVWKFHSKTIERTKKTAVCVHTLNFKSLKYTYVATVFKETHYIQYIYAM